MAFSGTDSSNDSWIRDCFSHVSGHGKTCFKKNINVLVLQRHVEDMKGMALLDIIQNPSELLFSV